MTTLEINQKLTTGQCYCGNVRFSINNLQPRLMTCHCTICQQLSAADCVSYAHSPLTEFSWLQGQQHMTYLQTSEDTIRPFCSRCGSQLPIVYEPMKQVFVPAVLLDTSEEMKVSGHCFVRSKKSWLQIPDDEAQYETLPEAS